jgi:anthranilate phosphoribosyltransferase
VVLLNAAAALSLADGDLAAGLAKAQETIDNGRALAALEAWVVKTNSFDGD